VPCQRSTFPVVVGEYGPVSLAVMPCSRQTRSNSTSAGRGLVNRPVNCLPLSVSTSDGTPYRFIAAVNASATARPDGTARTAAETMNREWSSMPDGRGLRSSRGPIAAALSPFRQAIKGRTHPSPRNDHAFRLKFDIALTCGKFRAANQPQIVRGPLIAFCPAGRDMPLLVILIPTGRNVKIKN
jgi:hypothetical protein